MIMVYTISYRMKNWFGIILSLGIILHSRMSDSRAFHWISALSSIWVSNCPREMSGYTWPNHIGILPNHIDIVTIYNLLTKLHNDVFVLYNYTLQNEVVCFELFQITLQSFLCLLSKCLMKKCIWSHWNQSRLFHSNTPGAE